jgi:OMF family outer membrane factor
MIRKKIIPIGLINMIFLILISVKVHGQTWTLKQCVDSAYANNTRISLANNEQEIANLKQKEVRANLLPKISINGEYKYFIELPYQLMPLSVFGGPEGQFKEAQFGVPHNINGNVVLQAPIYSSNLIGSIQKLSTTQRIVDIEVSKTYDQVYFEVATIYRNAQLLTSQLSFIDSTITNTEKIYRNIQLLAVEKLANQSDVQKLELKVSSLFLQQLTIKSHLQQLYNGLKLLTGTTADFEVENNLVMLDLKNYSPNGNKEIDKILLQQELISIDLKSLKRSTYLPELGFVATYGIQGFGYDQSPNSFLNFYPIGYAGMRLSYTVFNGTVTQKQIEQKELTYTSLKLQEKLIADARQLEIDNAVLKLENAFKSVELSDKQTELAHSIYQQELEKHAEGLVSINDLLIAQNELVQNQQNYLQQIALFLAADLELRNLTNNLSNN